MFEITIIPTLRREVKLQRNLKNRDFFTKEQDDNNIQCTSQPAGTYGTLNTHKLRSPTYIYPVDTGRKFNVHKGFRRRPTSYVRLLYVQFTSCVY